MQEWNFTRLQKTDNKYPVSSELKLKWINRIHASLSVLSTWQKTQWDYVMNWDGRFNFSMNCSCVHGNLVSKNNPFNILDP